MKSRAPILLALLSVVACGDDSGAVVDTSTTSSGSSTASSSSSTAVLDGSDSGSKSSESTTGPMPCMDNEDCGGGTPLCELVSGECVTCDGTEDPNGACAGVDPANPVCLDGGCVQCTAAAPEACRGMTPVCDDATNSCVPCTAHDQCTGEAACNLFTGACLPADAVVHVGPGQEHATLAAAVGSFAAGAEGTIVVHEPTASYIEAVTIDGGRVLAFLAANDVTAPPSWAETSEDRSQLEVAEDSIAIIDGLRISGNLLSTQPAVLVDGGRAWVDRSRIVQNSGGGIVAQNAAELVLRNCFVGGSVNNVAAMEVNGATADVLYTTLGAGFGAATALTCDAMASVDVRNSLLVSEDAGGDEVMCDATIEHSAAELDLGGTNTALGDMNTNWFVGYGTGDFSLSAMHPVAIDTAALWTTGDTTTDIDGDPRPTVDGTTDYAGADAVP